MKKNIFALGIASVLALSLLAGCSGQKAGTPDAGGAARKPVVNFEGVVTAAEDGTLTLDSGKTVVITDRTEFAPDPDSDGTVSRDIAVGNYIQGYTADGADDEKVTAENIWTNTVPTGGKMAVNFEGRVSAAEDGSSASSSTEISSSCPISWRYLSREAFSRFVIDFVIFSCLIKRCFF